MPDFTARIASGVTIETWDDHEGAGVSRINPLPEHPSKYMKATVGAELEFRASVGGVEAPLDAALGGRLFSADLGEWPGAMSPITSPAGQTSIQRFTPRTVGHYLLWIRRRDGGSVGFHFDAEEVRS